MSARRRAPAAAGAEPASFENLTQYYATPEFWYFT